MKHSLSSVVVVASLVVGLVSSIGRAEATPSVATQVFDRARQSVVAVRYTWALEVGPRTVELPGIVVDAAGTVMFSAGAVDDNVPVKQITDMTVVVPQPYGEPLELPAEYLGRDDRSHLAFARAKLPDSIKPLSFVDSTGDVGEAVYSVSLMGKASGYQPFVVHGLLSAILDGDRLQGLVDGQLAGVGAPVFNGRGEAIGFVDMPDVQRRTTASAGNASNGGDGPPPPPSVFTLSHDFLADLATPPSRERPIVTPWVGVFDWNGLRRDEATYYGIDGPAVQVGALAPGGPAATAGLAAGQIIVSLDGHPLARAQTPELTPALLRRAFRERKPGDVVTFGVIDGKGRPPRDVAVTLGTTPTRANAVDRFWADDLGFGVRDAVAVDRYALRLDAALPGVIVALLKPGSSASAAKLAAGSFVTRVNGTPVTAVADFAKTYQAARKDHPKDAVVLLVRREGREETIRIEASA